MGEWLVCLRLPLAFWLWGVNKHAAVSSFGFHDYIRYIRWRVKAGWRRTVESFILKLSCILAWLLSEQNKPACCMWPKLGCAWERKVLVSWACGRARDQPGVGVTVLLSPREVLLKFWDPVLGATKQVPVGTRPDFTSRCWLWFTLILLGVRKCFSWRLLLVLIEMDLLVFWNVKWELHSDSLQMVQPVGKLEAVGKQPGIIATHAGFSL